MNQKKILIVSGEPSGDLHASNLIKDLKTIDPDISFFGMGGSLSKKSGAEIVFDITELALIGLVEVIKNIGTVNRAYRALLSSIDSRRPDLAILIDYPGFNLRLARELNRRGIPIVYYISPQVWAWGKGRIELIKRYVKKMIVFFKFEEELYKKYGVDAEFVGHPLLDTVKTSAAKKEVFKKYGLSEEKTTIALLPGSRTMEVKNLLPLMTASAEMIAGQLTGLQFIISKHPDLSMDIYNDAVKYSSLKIKIVEGDTYNILGASDFAIVASGTATLETAIIGTPFLITYKINALTAVIYRLLVRARFVGLPNIILKKEVIPEILQEAATPQNISKCAVDILKSDYALESMRTALKEVRSLLGKPGASKLAAQIVSKIIQ